MLKASTRMQTDDQTPRCALISGGTGVTGRACAIKCASLPTFSKVITLSRRELNIPELQHHNLLHIQVDLSKPDCSGAVAEALVRANAFANDPPVYIFHCAYTETGDAVEDCNANLTLLRNLVEAAESAGADVAHVCTMEGTKWYGQHFAAALKTPYSEADPRHLPPNFYFDLQDYLEGRVAKGAAWTWSALRPGPVFGYSEGSYMNLSVSLGVYCSLCKEMGVALRFPGDPAAYDTVWEGVDAELLAEAMVFTSTTPSAQNQAFNISNGDVFRWRQVFETLAEFFEMPLAPPIHMSLVKQMADKGDVCASMVKKYGLKDIPLEKLVTFKFLDFIFSMPGDQFSNLTKLKQAGFNEMKVDSLEMFKKHMHNLLNQQLCRAPNGLRDKKVIP